MANVAKYTAGATGNMLAHYERKQKEDGSYVKFGNQEIDLEKTHLNYNLGPERDINQREFIEKRTSEIKCLKRNDVNVMCSWVVTLPKGHQGNEDAEKVFFEKSYEFLKKRYGEKNIISAYVHMDESTPHMHFAFIPVVPNTGKNKNFSEKLSAKEVLTREELSRFHGELDDHLRENVPEYSFDVVNEATREGNKEVVALKRESAMKEIKTLEYELEDVREKTALNVEDAHRNAQKEIDHVNWYLEQYGALEAFKPPQTKDIPKIVPGFSDYVAVKEKSFKKMIALVKGAIVVKAESKELEKAISDREAVADQREKRLDSRSGSFAIKEAGIAQKERDLEKREKKVAQAETDVLLERHKNKTIHEKHDVLEQKYNVLQEVNEQMKSALEKAKLKIIEQQNEINSLKSQIAVFPEKIKNAWGTCQAAVQAIGLLVHHKGEYKANLTEKQSRLVNAVGNYARDWAKAEGFSEVAKEINEKVKISKGVQNHIDELMPKQRSRGDDFGDR